MTKGVLRHILFFIEMVFILDNIYPYTYNTPIPPWV